MRLRELYESINLFENYQPKVTKLKTAFPDNVAAIEKHVSWAVKYLKKNQAIMWYVGIMEAGLTNNIEYLHQRIPPNFFTGDIFNSLDLIGEVLNHWVTTELAANRRITDVINTIRPDTNLINLLHRLTNAEAQIAKDNAIARENETPVEILQGDQPVLQVPSTGRTWWHLPYSSHKPESKFMDHCGTCQFDGNNLLSLRNAIPRPELTFEWNPTDHEIYQTKGPKNSKPNSKYYPDILALLLSPIVNGIAEDSWYPATDFSIFDMPENMVNQVVAAKPKLIDDQIEKYPIDFLRAPKSILANQRFRETAFAKSPGLSALITNDGEVDLSNESWETAIEQNEDLLIYAPETIVNYKERVGRLLGNKTNLFNYASAKVRNDLEIMKIAVAHNRDYSIFSHIPSHHKHYKALIHAAYDSGRDWPFDYFDTKFIDFDICVKALANSISPSYIFSEIEELGLLNPQDMQKLIKSAIETKPYIIQNLSGDLIDDFLTFEILKTAVSINGSVIDPSDLNWSIDDYFNMNEIYELAIIAVKTAPDLVPEFVHRFSFSDDQVFEICLSAAGAKGHYTLLDNLLEYDFFKSGVQTFRIASKAIANGASIDSIMPITGGEMLPVSAGYVTPDQYEQLAHQAVIKDGLELRSIDDNFKTFQLCKAAIKSNPIAFHAINPELLTSEEQEELRKLAHG